MKKKRLVVVAGFSAGHLLPALRLAEKWLQDNQGGEVFLFTSLSKLDVLVAKKYTFLTRIILLDFARFNTCSLFSYIKFLYQFVYSVIRSFWVLLRWRPEKVISTGGSLSLPIAFSAFFLNIRLDLYELNVLPGRAIKFLEPFAFKINICFTQTKKYLSKKVAKKICLVEYPLQFINFGEIVLKNKKKTLLVLGGSQGSFALNNLLISYVELNSQTFSSWRIIHQCGEKDYIRVKKWYENYSFDYKLFSYNDNLEYYYKIADLVLARAGAGTLFELQFFKKKSIIFPLSLSHDNHQVYNAYYMQKKNPELFNLVEGKDKVQELEIFSQILNNVIKQRLEN